MSTPVTRRRAIFTYPDYGYPSSYPEHDAHSGQEVTVLRELVEGVEYDAVDFDEDGKPIDPMFEIEASDGWCGLAWESELQFLPQGD